MLRDPEPGGPAAGSAAGSTSPTLRRVLGPLAVTTLTLNAIVGAGIFALPGRLVESAGSLSLAVLLIGFALIAAMALCTVEVASRFEVTGGPPHYAQVVFGPMAGFLIGWLLYLSRLASFAAIVTIMFDYLAGLWPLAGTGPGRIAGTTAVIAVLAAVNVRGVDRGAQLVNGLSIIKFLPLVLLAAAGLGLAGWQSQPTNAPAGVTGLSQALLLCMFSCIGFESATVVSGEVRNPRRSLPLGILLGLGCVGVLYVLVMLATFAHVPELAGAQRPLADLAHALIGPIGVLLVTLTAFVSCAGILGSMMLTTPRVLFNLAEQGAMPRRLLAIDARYATPATAILVTSVLLWAVTISGGFVYLATFAIVARMLIYASTCAALIALRRTQGPAPVPIPAGPLLAIVSIASCLAILATTDGLALRDVTLAAIGGFALRALTRRFSPSA